MTLMGTVTGLFALFLGVLPGLPGELVFRSLVVTSWREKERTFYLRVSIFSAFGLSLMTALGWSEYPALALAMVQRSGTDPALTDGTLLRVLAGGYLAHTGWSLVIALFVAGCYLATRRLVPGWVRHADTWDEFVGNYAARRWVIVTLNNGETYVGRVHQADVSCEAEQRGLVLVEPAVYDENKRNYVATTNLYLYLPGAAIAHVAVAGEPADDRVVRPGRPVFTERILDDEENAGS